MLTCLPFHSIHKILVYTVGIEDHAHLNFINNSKTSVKQKAFKNNAKKKMHAKLFIYMHYSYYMYVEIVSL